jgi:hypothetical protein
MVNKSISIVHHIPSVPRQAITCTSIRYSRLEQYLQLATSPRFDSRVKRSPTLNGSIVRSRSDVDFQQDLGPRHSLVAILEWQLVSWASLIHA